MKFYSLLLILSVLGIVYAKQYPLLDFDNIYFTQASESDYTIEGTDIHISDSCSAVVMESSDSLLYHQDLLVDCSTSNSSILRPSLLLGLFVSFLMATKNLKFFSVAVLCCFFVAYAHADHSVNYTIQKNGTSIGINISKYPDFQAFNATYLVQSSNKYFDGLEAHYYYFEQLQRSVILFPEHPEMAIFDEFLGVPKVYNSVGQCLVMDRGYIVEATRLPGSSCYWWIYEDSTADHICLYDHVVTTYANPLREYTIQEFSDNVVQWDPDWDICYSEERIVSQCYRGINCECCQSIAGLAIFATGTAVCMPFTGAAAMACGAAAHFAVDELKGFGISVEEKACEIIGYC